MGKLRCCLDADGAGGGGAEGAVFEGFAEVAGAVGEGGGLVFFDGVDQGGFGVHAEVNPAGLVLGDAAAGRLNLAAEFFGLP